ncbi:MAG: chorismate dehydratase [Acidobacteriota bacterium]|jgi:chorismate dehydratase|nr:MAG: chorismate dehydratase [Acidobacteriota bacterium]
MSAIRVGAVQYLNARPLVHGLDSQKDLFSLEFDVPAKCASLLHERSIDLGLIPTIEYLRKPNYRLVADIGVVSHGPVESVALFTSRPVQAIRSIAVDTSSRTAATLLRILCAEWFDIEPNFHTMPPDLDSMLKRCDAALLIGDVALYTEHETIVDLDKIDLGEEWTSMTNLPFVWAVWSGRDGAVDSEHLSALEKARDAGVQALDEIAEKFGPTDEDQAELAREYLQKNVQFELSDECRNGLRRYFDFALKMGIYQHSGELQFYEK